MTEKHILVACYYFPPYPGIGGRRTAKFCKYLAKKGYTIHLVQAESPYEGTESVWLQDTLHPNIIRHTIPLHYPKVLIMEEDLQYRKPSLWKRIAYKVVKSYYSFIQPKRIYDPTFLWEKPFTRKLTELTQKYPIQNIWASVSPHYYALYAARFKRNHPDINFIIDFRDSWINIRDFGMQEMTDSQRNHELEVIRETVQEANYILAPVSVLFKEFSPYLSDGAKAIELTHAYDPEDLAPHLSRSQARDDDKIRMIYGGVLYTDLGKNLKFLSKGLDFIRDNHPSIYNRIQIDFYADEHKYADLFTEHVSKVAFHKPIGKKIFEEIAQSTHILILYADHNKHYRTTKFYENLPFKKPYLYLGPQGDTYRFIQEHQLGHVIDTDGEMGPLIEVFEAAASGNETYQPAIDTTEFSFVKQADFIETLFQ